MTLAIQPERHGIYPALTQRLFRGPQRIPQQSLTKKEVIKEDGFAYQTLVDIDETHATYLFASWTEAGRMSFPPKLNKYSCRKSSKIILFAKQESLIRAILWAAEIDRLRTPATITTGLFYHYGYVNDVAVRSPACQAGRQFADANPVAAVCNHRACGGRQIQQKLEKDPREGAEIRCKGTGYQQDAGDKSGIASGICYVAESRLESNGPKKH